MSRGRADSLFPVRPAAVLWDMDGTIVDTEPYWIETEHELVAEFGGHWDDEKAHSLVGKDLRDSAAILRDRGGVDLPIDDIVNRLLDGVILRVQRNVPWRPGARELLAALNRAGIPTALVTMSWQRFADAVVSALPTGSFTVVVTGDQVTNGKPHPEPYLAAAAALGLRPEDCVAIEDSPTGLRSAVAAGCRTIAVPNVVHIPDAADYTKVASLLHLDPGQLGLPPARGAGRAPNWRRLLAGGAAVAALVAGAVYVLKPSTPPPYPNVPVAAWAPWWTVDDTIESVRTNGSLLTEVSPVWFEARGATDIAPPSNTNLGELAPLVEAVRSSGALLLPSVVDAMPAGGMAKVLGGSATRAEHVAALVDLAVGQGYDGIDLDYEQFAFADKPSSWQTTSNSWVQFIRELGPALHAQGKLLSVTIPPIYDTDTSGLSGYWVYRSADIDDFVDRIRVMAYDYSTGSPGPIAPYQWVRTIVRATKRAVGDDRKVVLGIPLYGRNWVTGTTGTCPATAEGTTTVSLRNLPDLIARRGGTPVPDPTNRESSFTYRLEVSDGGATCTQDREVHWVDEDGVRARIDLARAERIGGVSFWALGFDSPSAWELTAPVATPRSAGGDTP
ncbi:MAG: HAD-IA family hydrolase [Acidobacteria bacterium]|nr:HAD-IA family hydrolase [Acidobacteriota bacterium]